jgi:hypothetical protein
MSALVRLPTIQVLYPPSREGRNSGGGGGPPDALRGFLWVPYRLNAACDFPCFKPGSRPCGRCYWHPCSPTCQLKESHDT